MTDMIELRDLISLFDDRDPDTIAPEELLAAVEKLDEAFSGWSELQLGTLFFNIGVKLSDTPEGQERLTACSAMITRFIHDMYHLRDQQRKMN